MEIIFLVVAAGIVSLYLFNATLCYVVVGGGYLAIVTSMIISRIVNARKLKVRLEPVNTFGRGVRVGSLNRVTSQMKPT